MKPSLSPFLHWQIHLVELGGMLKHLLNSESAQSVRLEIGSRITDIATDIRCSNSSISYAPRSNWESIGCLTFEVEKLTLCINSHPIELLDHRIKPKLMFDLLNWSARGWDILRVHLWYSQPTISMKTLGHRVHLIWLFRRPSNPISPSSPVYDPEYVCSRAISVMFLGGSLCKLGSRSTSMVNGVPNIEAPSR